MPDLTAPPTAIPMFTVRVHDFKDDPQAESVSVHGVFTDRDAAEAFARDIRMEAYPDFLKAEVVPLLPATRKAVADAQLIDWVPGEPGEGDA